MLYLLRTQGTESKETLFGLSAEQIGHAYNWDLGANLSKGPTRKAEKQTVFKANYDFKYTSINIMLKVLKL